MNLMKTKYLITFISVVFYACKPELPVTSHITVDLEKAATPVNKELYGISLEEINHAIEGGIYAELVQNRSFEEGAPLAGCLYDEASNTISTPAGWKIPFVAPNVIPGWRALSDQSFLSVTESWPVNKQNRHSLQVHISAYGKGGAVAEGFYGIPVRKGEKYQLSFFVRSSQYGEITVQLRDAAAHKAVSDTYQMFTAWEWTQVQHTFTATEDVSDATLVFEAEKGTVFNIDMVSLFPQKTWNNHAKNLRPDLMETIQALHPRFIRFPGGAFAESFTKEMIPLWQETAGPVESRKSLWSIWGYGTANGFGFHDYMQLCEDLNAYPVYVANAGMLNQRYRLRYEETKNMTFWKEQLLSALAYALHPNDSVYGQMRALNGHPAPFSLDFVEIGNRHRGYVYNRHYQYLREAVKEAFPQITLLCNDTLKYIGDWYDIHYNTDAEYLLSNYNMFDVRNPSIHTPTCFIGEFGAAHSPHGGTLRGAVSEAAFLIGAEKNPLNVKGIAYAPLLGHTEFLSYGIPAIQFDASRIVKHPSYHVLEMFANNRGDELLHTSVNTYQKPLVTFGRAGVMLYDFHFNVKDMLLNNDSVYGTFTKDERSNSISVPAAKNTASPRVIGLNRGTNGSSGENRAAQDMISPEDGSKRYLFAGDSTDYNYTFSVKIRQVIPDGKIQLRVRDNGLPEERSHFIALNIEGGNIGLYHCGGNMERLLSGKKIVFEPNRWYTVDIVCMDEQIKCFIDHQPVLEAAVFSIPSLISVATREIASKTIILKVVNTTYHEEWASLDMVGGSIENEAEIIQLTGKPDVRNSLEAPETIIPQRETIHFSFRRPIKYRFPSNSVTIIRMKQK
ncbi:MAG: carbohydrate binding domain-containing protein [Tannerella sp.]|jgi:alpha-L-arabinofuranosidase|nr:carbohydrate binding domain-containing protein [Tannerella sp.]